MFVKKGVVIDKGGAGEIDSTHVSSPATVVINNKIYVFYSAHSGTTVRIALAISEDGMNFVKKGIVIDKGGAGEVDSSYAYNPAVVVINNKIYVFYATHDGSNQRIALAISEDGMNFVKKGIVIDKGGAGEIDSTHANTPAAVVINNKIYVFYSAHNEPNYRIALAISEDGMNFVKKGIVIDKGGAGEIDSTHANTPAVVVINNKIYVFYNADDGTNVRIALAISEDGI